MIERLRRPLMLLASVGVSAAVLFVDTPAPVVERAVSTPAPTVAPTPPPVFVPAEVEIPKIDMTAPTVPVGTTDDGAMDTPKSAVDIAWWAGTKAGEGNVLLAAHHDWKGQLGSFYRLDELEVGDEIRVRGEGEELVFVVEWKEQMDADVDATDILGDQGEPVATLITCGGEFDTSIRSHVDRIVVRGVLKA